MCRAIIPLFNTIVSICDERATSANSSISRQDIIKLLTLNELVDLSHSSLNSKQTTALQDYLDFLSHDGRDNLNIMQKRHAQELSYLSNCMLSFSKKISKQCGLNGE